MENIFDTKNKRAVRGEALLLREKNVAIEFFVAPWTFVRCLGGFTGLAHPGPRRSWPMPASGALCCPCHASCAFLTSDDCLPLQFSVP